MAKPHYRGGLNFQQVNQAKRLYAADHTIAAIAAAMLVSVECVESHVVGVKKKKRRPPVRKAPADDFPVLGNGEEIPED